MEMTIKKKKGCMEMIVGEMFFSVATRTKRIPFETCFVPREKIENFDAATSYAIDEEDLNT